MKLLVCTFVMCVMTGNASQVGSNLTKQVCRNVVLARCGFSNKDTQALQDPELKTITWVRRTEPDVTVGPESYSCVLPCGLKVVVHEFDPEHATVITTEDTPEISLEVASGFFTALREQWKSGSRVQTRL